MSTPILEMDDAELDALKARIVEAQEHDLALSKADMALLFDVLETLAFLQERLTDKDITLHKMRKLLGIVKSSEKLRDLATSSEDRESSRSGQSKKNPRGPRIKAPVKAPEIIHHKLESIKKGDDCPACEVGKVYKYEPARLLRITGNAPLTPELHLSERLRCNACGAFFTADLPAEVVADGEADQKYGHSARSVITLNKYFGGTPFYRQESLQNLLGVPVTASTAFDQCEQVANALFPVFRHMQRLAADARHYHLDDTSHRILDQVPVKKKKRNGTQEQLRTGVYSSGLIAELVTGEEIILFQTNIGHAGEFIDEILQQRSPGIPPPLTMSDALPHNKPTVTSFIQSLCNAHGRRQYVDVHDHFVDKVEWVLERYSHIWRHESESKNQNHTPAQRLAWHAEHSLPIMEEIRAWGVSQLETDEVEANSGLGKAIRYFDKHYDGLTRFCTQEGARIDNNAMERHLKLVVRNRKNANFYKTAAGAAIGDVLTSVIATAAEAQINIFEYLNTVQQHQAKAAVNPGQWLPWNYADQLQTVQKSEE